MSETYESIWEAARRLSAELQRQLAEQLLEKVGRYDDERDEGLRSGLADEGAGKKTRSHLEDEEFEELLRRHVGPLSEREWRLFEMHTIEGMRPKEIAEELGEDRRLISAEINALKAKLKGRMRSRIAAAPEAKGGKARRYFGAWDSSDERSADNERIDRDLASEYDNSR